jgi:hypothetical protein
MPWSLDRPGEAGATVLVQPSAPPHRPDRTDPPGRTRWRRVVIVVAAIAILAGAAYLASPAIGDWGGIPWSPRDWGGRTMKMRRGERRPMVNTVERAALIAATGTEGALTSGRRSSART